jgi:REP element-mobilizing transposase RayT
MANTYTQLYIQCVFAVKGRKKVITKDFSDELYKYMSGILRQQNAYPLAVGGWKDHVHVFFELKPDFKLSDIIRVLKACSSKWINENKFVQGKFQWQEGYGGFSYAHSQRDRVIKYIMNQERHHTLKTFRKEYLEFLERFEIEYKDQYLFEFYD